MVYFVLWLEGVLLSSINVIKSSRARKYLEKTDKSFCEYMENKTDEEKALLNAKAIIKMLIPVYNIIHPVKLLFKRSYELANIWKLDILKKDEKKKARLKLQEKNTEEVKKEEKVEKPQVKKETVTKETTKNTTKDKYQMLSEYYDSLNNSNIDYNDVMKCYIVAYKNAKLNYLEAKKKNDQKAMLDCYKMMKLASDKSIELKDKRAKGVSRILK